MCARKQHRHRRRIPALTVDKLTIPSFPLFIKPPRVHSETLVPHNPPKSLQFFFWRWNSGRTHWNFYILKHRCISTGKREILF
jgi:hypothetical protein